MTKSGKRVTSRKFPSLFDIRVPLYAIIVGDYPCESPTHYGTYYDEEAAERALQHVKGEFDFAAIYKVEPAQLRIERGFVKRQGRPRKIRFS